MNCCHFLCEDLVETFSVAPVILFLCIAFLTFRVHSSFM